MSNNSTDDYVAGIIPWPRSIDDIGRYGIVGEFLRLVEPETEADANAVLITFLTFAGNQIGRNYCVMAGADAHFTNMFACIVGSTGTGRKGSAISVAEAFFGTRYSAPPAPKLGHVLKGISTGEGLVFEVHDDIYKMTLDKRTGKYERVLAEPNEPDKRLLIVLSEFQQCLANMRRPDSILPSIMRTAWDKGDLSTPAKNNRATATGAHISIVTAISKEELLEQTSASDAENGTLNRFVFVCSHRSKLLPEGGSFRKLTKSPEWLELQDRYARNIEMNGEEPPVQMQRDVESNDIWGFNDAPEHGLYKHLSAHRVGLFGSVTARAPQQVLRLAIITAVINGARIIQRQHLDAAAEIWRYCDDSARWIFGDSLKDPVAIEILKALKAAGKHGLTRNEIYRDVFRAHKTREEIDRALLWLANARYARFERGETAGRPIQTWYAL